jgi:CheY-like chemotaxis protein
MRASTKLFGSAYEEELTREERAAIGELVMRSRQNTSPSDSPEPPTSPELTTLKWNPHPEPDPISHDPEPLPSATPPIPNPSPSPNTADGPEGSCMHQNTKLPTTSVLLIDGSKNHRADWIKQLRHCSPAYEIVEASEGKSGLDLYWSRQIDCVVLELSLPDQSGFTVLGELVPLPRRPQVAVIVLTQIPHRGVWELATLSGARACFYKPHTSGKDLDQAIQRAVVSVSQRLKDDNQQRAT